MVEIPVKFFKHLVNWNIFLSLNGQIIRFPALAIDTVEAAGLMGSQVYA